ncbi:helix-turn-helix domain-containing protein [Planctomicrobium piriforme]|uniref:Cro/C1-type HTH DNA-binding domain-containing protein n=1 Tax=Planctomicrobium piriforme TaxID=1576369 RepID=A0A1I3R6F4_9PLAN|nr:helix-turn-helix transcriptional regulator [Planctomicrobium piriforme]SFJ42194.1 Cro/C1-type HTH DNA-binding domain-containing protein [Planctomicrobium piriforme]
MHDPEFLLAALKSMLKERRIGYAALAAELDVSLLTVKRTLNKAAVPLDRLLEICRIAKIDFAELVERAAAIKPRHTFFDAKQDELFTRCPPMLTYFTALQSGQSPADIAKQFHLMSASTTRYLDALAGVGLVKVTGSGTWIEVESLMEPPVGFSPGSSTLARLSAAFLTSVVERVVAAASRHDADFSLLKPLRLSERQYRQMTGELYDVVNRYSFLSESVGFAADEDERPQWQLAIAASLADRTSDPESAIRNLKPNEAT